MHKEYDFSNKKYSEEEIRNYIKSYPEKCGWYLWYTISEYQDLSETFIREFKDQVNWAFISASQNLSEKFSIEFIDKIEIGNDEIYGLIDNIKIPEKVKNRIINLKKVRNS